MTDETKRPEGSDGDQDKPKKRGFFSRLFGRGSEADAPEVRPDDRPDDHDRPADPGTEAEAPEVRPDLRAPVDHDQPAEGGRDVVEPEVTEEAFEPTEPEAFDPEVRPDLRAPVDHDQPAEGGEDVVEEQAAHEVAEDIGEAIEDAAAEPEPEPVTEPEPPAQKKSWFARLRDGLSRSSSKLTEGITGLFLKRKLDDEALEELEELLITADLGVTTAAKLTASLAKERFGRDVTGEEVRKAFAEDIAEILEPVARPLAIDRTRKPHVVLVVGVNGSGKTTTIGKLCHQWRDQGLKVMIAAGDTFRAAAVEQLKVWGDRTGAPVISRDTGADAAGLAFDALKEAQAAGADVLLIDTAGRLQNKKGLMDELQKIVRVLKKMDPDTPHDTLLVLDATVGQNAHSQVEVFKEMVNVTGLVMTKLDGTAKGGVVVALADRFGLPVHFIGVGETAEDLRPFKAEDFARGLMGV